MRMSGTALAAKKLFLSNPKILLPAGVLTLLFLFAFAGPLFCANDYSAQLRGMENLAPCWAFPFGTDNLGRDLLARSMIGTRISLSVGIAASLIALAIGTVYGAVSGYLGGRADDLMMRLVDLIYSVPDVLLVLLLSTVLRDPLTGRIGQGNGTGFLDVLGPGLLSVFLAFGLLYWVGMARIVRGQVLTLRGQEFIIAAKASGASGWRIIRKHLLPNCAGPIIVTACLQVPTAIFLESFLSFLGLGVSAPLTSLGSLLSDALSGMYSYPLRLVFPALLLTIMIMALNFLGDGLQDLLDPLAAQSKKRPGTHAAVKNAVRKTRPTEGGELLTVQNLHVVFREADREFEAVRGISYSIRKGEILGIIGESGSGKSLQASAAVNLLKPGAVITEGSAVFCGRDLLMLSERELRGIRGTGIALMLQDPASCLDPLCTIGKQLTEAIRAKRKTTGAEADEEAMTALERVGISDPERRMEQYPYELSGGMCQRVLLAAALLGHPKLLIADEPTTSLDVTTQAQILELFAEIREKEETAVLLITNDISVAAASCDAVCVMYAGRIVERGKVETVFTRPYHPYTEALLQAIPPTEAVQKERLIPIEGVPAVLSCLPPGCPFSPRCPKKTDRCLCEEPPEIDLGRGHTAACWRLLPEEEKEEFTDV